MRYLISLVSALLMIISGCDSGSSVSDSEELVKSEEKQTEIYIGNSTPGGKPFTYPVLIDENGDLKKESELTQEELKLLKEQRKTYLGAKRSIREALETRNPGAADEEIREVLVSIKSHPLAHSIEQYAANKILKHEFEQSENFLSTKQIAYYTDLLVNNNHPDAVILYKALKKLEGHWTDEKIKSSAQVVMEAAQKKLRKKKSQKDLEKLGYDENFISALNAKYEAIDQYVNKLRNLIKTEN